MTEEIATAVRTSGLSQAEIARRVSARLNRNFDRSMINKFMIGKRKLSSDEYVALREILGLSEKRAADAERRLTSEPPSERSERDSIFSLPAIGQRLRFLREQRELRADQLAVMLGVPVRLYEDWERGSDRISDRFAYEFTRHVGGTLDFIYGEILDGLPHRLAVAWESSRTTRSEVA